LSDVVKNPHFRHDRQFSSFRQFFRQKRNPLQPVNQSQSFSRLFKANGSQGQTTYSQHQYQQEATLG